MKTIAFCTWLQGFFDISEANTLSPKQVAVIKAHLALTSVGQAPTGTLTYGGEGNRVDLPEALPEAPTGTPTQDANKMTAGPCVTDGRVPRGMTGREKFGTEPITFRATATEGVIAEEFAETSTPMISGHIPFGRNFDDIVADKITIDPGTVRFTTVTPWPGMGAAKKPAVETTEILSAKEKMLAQLKALEESWHDRIPTNAEEAVVAQLNKERES